MLWGYSLEIERSGQEFYAHKTGFTQNSLLRALQNAGFARIYSKVGNIEIDALAFKRIPNQKTRELFNLPADIPGGVK